MSKRIEEFKKMANDTITESKSRGSIIEKLAFSGTPRRQLEKDLIKARKDYDKARKDYDLASAELNAAQHKVDTAQSAMSANRTSIIELNEALKNMDLTGADSLKVDKGGDVSYIKDNKRYSLDTSDANDVKLVPYQKRDKNMADAPDDIEDASEDDEVDGATLDATISAINDSLAENDLFADEEMEVAALAKSLELVKSARSKFR